MAGDYLDAEPLIIARIKAKLPTLRDVVGVASIEDAFEYQQTLPVVFVAYYGDVVGASAGSGQGQLYDQRYVVMPAVKNVLDTRGGSGARKEIGPLLYQVNEVLLGWQPSPEHGPLRKANSPRAPYVPGFAYYPQMFTTSIAMIGDPN